LYSYVLAAYAKLDAFNSPQLAAVFEALPRIAPYPAWLDEVGGRVALCQTFLIGLVGSRSRAS
jgi:hypothetical protein